MGLFGRSSRTAVCLDVTLSSSALAYRLVCVSLPDLCASHRPSVARPRLSLSASLSPLPLDLRNSACPPSLGLIGLRQLPLVAIRSPLRSPIII
ncbi:hypothetical protein CRG98_035906, partial [Punica granatum]